MQPTAPAESVDAVAVSPSDTPSQYGAFAHSRPLLESLENPSQDGPSVALSLPSLSRNQPPFLPKYSGAQFEAMPISAMDNLVETYLLGRATPLGNKLPLPWEPAPTSPKPMDVDSPSITKPPRSPPPQSSSLRKVLNPPFLLEHFYMDLPLLNFFREYSRTGPPPDFKRIAYILVLTCPELDRERFKKADDFDDLLQLFPVLDSISKDCWREGSFRALRELEIFWPDPDKLFKREVSLRAFEQAWNASYESDHHEFLFDTVKEIKSDAFAEYSNSASVIQSSGSGKSRMVDEMASLVFTLPFNLRAARDVYGLAWPPPDDAVRDYLSVIELDSYEQHMRYITFFINLFETVRERLILLRQEGRIGEDLAKDWKTYLSAMPQRTELYNTVVARKTIDEIKQHAFEISRPGAEIKNPFDQWRSLSNLALIEFRKLLQVLDGSSHWIKNQSLSRKDTADIKLVIYFDDADDLAGKKPNHSQGTLYDILQSVCNCFKPMPLFAIFLSTASHISSFARPMGNVSSSRFVYIESENPRAPVNETPFDIAPNFDVGSRELGVRDVSQIAFMANFGRPLWWAMLHGSGRIDELGALGFDLLDLARRKLIGDQDPNETALSDTTAALAVVDVRLCLDHDSRRAQTRGVLDEMMRKHMRVLYSMPQHREHYQSGYPSEPILAEAAAMQLDHWRSETNRTVLIDTLSSFVQKTHLNVGDRAEVVGRALLTEAYDRAIIAEHPAPSEARFSQGCLLTSFIRELLTEEAALAVLESQPDNVPDGATFGNAFKDSRVRFTHFTKLDDEESLITAMLFVAFVRGMAFVASSDEAFIDVVIPVSLRDEKLGESGMTRILIQFKRWGHARTAAKVEIDAERLGFFPSTQESPPRPYCALVMQLKVHPPKGVIHGGQGKEGLGEQTTEPLILRGNAPGLVSKVKRRWESLQLAEQDATHPRYSFSVYGCSNAVYKGILEEDNHKYAALISSGNTFHDHGRQTEEQLAQVWRMKPCWSAAMGSYHWVEGADITSNVLDEGDEVAISQYPGYEDENSG